MPAVARGTTVDDVTTNHGCDSETTTEGASLTVFLNGTGVHRKGDLNTEHTWPPTDSCPAHQTGITVGSLTVFANTFGVARKGDFYDEGEEVSSGSSNVFADGL